MNLKYELPEDALKAASEYIDKSNAKSSIKDGISDNIKSSILYCVPFDLNSEGGYTDGWFVIMSDIALVIDKGVVIEKLPVINGHDYKQTNLVGNGILEGIIDGIERTVVRYSMAHVPRYVYIARILNLLSKGRHTILYGRPDSCFVNDVIPMNKHISKPDNFLMIGNFV